MEETTPVIALFVWRRRMIDRKQGQVQHLLSPSFLLTTMITAAAAAADTK